MKYRCYNKKNTSYLTNEEKKAFHNAKYLFRQGICPDEKVLYAYNVGNDGDSLYYHSLNIYYTNGFTVVIGGFGGVRDLVKGEWSPDEISRRNTGVSQEGLFKRWRKRWDREI